MKYFLKWLAQDIKRDWKENWPCRRNTLQYMWDGAKTVIQFASWFILFISITAILLLKMHGNDIDWLAGGKVLGGVALLNLTIYISGKLSEYRKDQEQLLQTLKE